MPALVDIDLDIRSREFVSVVGPSGCGKSTLLKLVAGLENASSGSLRINGRALKGPPDRLGVVFQRDVLLDWRTILDNVLALDRIHPQADAPPSENARSRFSRGSGSAASSIAFPGNCPAACGSAPRSAGRCWRTPNLLLMDEPFGALDAMTRDDLNVELAQIWQDTRKTLLFITHSIAEAVFLSDRVVMMSKAPGIIVEAIKIDLPRPRRLAVRDTADFGAYVHRIRHHFAQLGIVKE